MEHKKLKNRILTVLTSFLVLANLAAAPFATAETIECNYLNPKSKPEDPKSTEANPKYSVIKNMVITINEEEIGNETKVGEMQVKPCIRKTDCTKDTGCNSYYVNIGECTPKTTDKVTYTACQRVQVLYAPSGAGLLYGYIGLIYKYAAGIIGIISVLYLVWGGIMITTAGDNTGRIDEAKTKIFQSIAGLILLFLSAVILYTINPNFFTM
jgi:hypothetical protein